MFSRRSSEASSCLMRFCTGTLRAASVRGVTVPVAASPWRTWKRFIASATTSSYGPVVGLSAARSPLTSKRRRSRSSFGPATPDGECGIGRKHRPAAAHRQIGITQRGLLEALRGAFVEGRFMRQRQRRRRARFGGGCGGGRLGRGRMCGICRRRRRRLRRLAECRRGAKHRGDGNDGHSSHIGCPWRAADEVEDEFGPLGPKQADRSRSEKTGLLRI